MFSSSKGSELSYESDTIQNGFFTESIIRALISDDADKDGTVSTDELRLYIVDSVASNTGRLQHPTVDRDNIYQKFSFPLRRRCINNLELKLYFGHYTDNRKTEWPMHTGQIIVSHVGTSSCVWPLLRHTYRESLRDIEMWWQN